jgi:NAD(P)-dependent dehydrogenase (short-subunit alcohol dehydrogenase family)
MSTQNTYVIVGASTGLGRATARILVRDHRVIIAGRDVEQLRAAVPGAAEALRVDLRDLGDARRFADELIALGPIHGLVCNAGVQHVAAQPPTRDGHDETFAVNHLAHFAIAMRLASGAAFAPDARLVWIGSGTLVPGDRGARMFGFRGGRYTSARELAAGAGDPSASEAQRGRDAYATSKLCNLLAMNAIARRAPAQRLATFALDPGLMPGTGLARGRSAIERFAWTTVMRGAGLVMPGASSASRSGRALAWLVTSPALAGTTGRYFDYRRRERTPCAIARDAAHADELYTAGLELCGQRDPFGASGKLAV